MRTTIDLPDSLFRQVKARAALEGRTLKELLAEYVEQGLARHTGAAPPGPRRRSDPPVFVREAATGALRPFRTNAELEELLLQEEIERCRTSSM